MKTTYQKRIQGEERIQRNEDSGLIIGIALFQDDEAKMNQQREQGEYYISGQNIDEKEEIAIVAAS